MKLFSKSRNRFDGVADGRTFDRMKETIIQSNPPPSSTPLKPRRRWSSPVNEGREELPLTERKRALFEPLDPIRRHDNNNLLPPPDFDAATYPSGWVVGKKRKLVNVDVVESMRRIAVHEMNRKCLILMGSFFVQTLVALVYTFTEPRLQSPTELLCLTYNHSIEQFAHW
jgi:hypothetical protein